LVRPPDPPSVDVVEVVLDGQGWRRPLPRLPAGAQSTWLSTCSTWGEVVVDVEESVGPGAVVVVVVDGPDGSAVPAAPTLPAVVDVVGPVEFGAVAVGALGCLPVVFVVRAGALGV
jgi:hypothetical protein